MHCSYGITSRCFQQRLRSLVVDFRLDDDQLDLQQTVSRFGADRFPLDAIADRERRPVDRATWQQLADLGVLGLLSADGDGGPGLGVVEAAIVFEQLGSHLVSGPVLWTVLAAPLVDGAAAGDRLVGGVAADSIDGDAAVVEHAADVDVVLVVSESAVVAHRTDELTGPVELEPLDPTTPVGRFTGIASHRGEPLGDAGTAARVAMLGTVLSAAMLVGVATRALEVARSYALERSQFGAPIGSFQAVKHLLADMYVRANLAQSSTYAAAAIADDPSGAATERAAAGAKLLAADAAIANAGTAIQVLGGMGFTWAMLPNYLLKRAWVLEQSFGTVDEHALALGASLA
jgi:alkylation response protein AidB-like acyl-CoA dehydrogenase